MEEKLLPIGTVCMLKGGTKRVMITGFCSIPAEDPKRIFDYSGCLYPEGFLNTSNVCLFDNNQIEKVYFKGLEDEEEIKFKEKLSLVVKEIKTKAKEEVKKESSLEKFDVEE